MSFTQRPTTPKGQTRIGHLTTPPFRTKKKACLLQTNYNVTKHDERENTFLLANPPYTDEEWTRFDQFCKTIGAEYKWCEDMLTCCTVEIML